MPTYPSSGTTGWDIPLKAYIDATASFVTFLPASTGSDDTSAVNTVLAASSGLTVRGRPGQTYLISAPLVLQSNTTLDMTGCTIQGAASWTGGNMLRNASANAGAAATGTGSITVATNTLTTSLSTSAVVGQSVYVAGAGLSGGALCGIVSAAGGGTITVTDGDGNALNAVATVSGAAVTLWNRDTKIEVIGGTWNRGAVSSPTDDTGRHSLFFRRVDGLRVRYPTHSSTAGKYAINVGDVTDYTVEHVRLPSTASDGVHVNGPAYHGRVAHVRGTSGDDTVAITAVDFSQYNDVQGPINDFLVYDVDSSSSTNSVRLSGKLDRIVAEKINSRSGLPVVSFSGTLDVGSVTTRDTSGGSIVFPAGAFSVKKALIDNHRRVATANSQVCVSVGCPIDTLEIRGSEFLGGTFTGTTFCTIGANSTITTLMLKDINHTGTSAYTVLLNASGATVTDAWLSGIHHEGVTTSGGILQAVSGAVITRCRFSDIANTSTSWLADLTGQTTTFYLSNVRGTGFINPHTSGSVTLYGDCDFTSMGTLAGTINPKSYGVTVDITKVTKTALNMAYNTNTGASCGAGPVHCNAAGTLYTNVITGATF